MEKKEDSEFKIAIVGLGYVGMPLAVAFSEQFPVIGFDVNSRKIAQYKKGIDETLEVGDEVISSCSVEFTDEEAKLREASFVVVAVPTPINGDKTPDLSPVIRASETVGRNLRSGAIVVYESTVYPGVTEEICAPILEKSIRATGFTRSNRSGRSYREWIRKHETGSGRYMIQLLKQERFRYPLLRRRRQSR